jgi:Tol biopolymer transport system component
MRILSCLAAALLLAPLAACEGGGGPVDVGDRLVVAAEGRAERGSTVQLSFKKNGADVAASQVQVTVEPAGAAEVQPDGRVRLLQAGALTVNASATGATGSLQVQVATPPIVVFDRLVSGNRDIWKVALDGGDLARLTEDLGDDQDPTAAQGTVVFVSYRDGNAELYRVPLAGGASTRLTTTPKNETAPALSRDGQRLAFTYDDTGVTKLWTSQSNGTGAARATTDAFGFSGSIEASPAWAPTSTRLVFVATNAGTADLYDLTLPANFSLLSGTGSAEVEPAWSADGQWVVFASNRDAASNTELYLLRVSSGGVTRLTNRAGVDALPSWTPDGRIVYVEITGGVSRLRWMDPADPATVHAIETGEGNATRPAVAQ